MKHRNSFMNPTLLCGFLIFAFHFSKDGVRWFWTGLEIVPIFLGICTLGFAFLWILEAKNKLKKHKG